jgi:4,5-dihydroxyphthalate decarboxylase
VSPDYKVTVACSTCDRTEPLLQGAVRSTGMDLRVVAVNHAGQRAAAFKKGEFDVAEFSLGELVYSSSRDDSPWVGIPVFPLRAFRHSYVFCNAASGIEGPYDLRHKKVGLFRLAQTACIWIRGLLVDEYRLPPNDVRWYVPATNPIHHSAEGFHGSAIETRDGATVQLLADEGEKEGASLLESALIAGRLDALCSAAVPKVFANRDARVRRLFRDYRGVEADYYRRTRIHPIMHVLAARREVVEQRPELAAELFRVFSAAKKLARQRLKMEGSVSLAWKENYLEEEEELFGEDGWGYGLGRNRHVLSKFLQYAYDLGVSARKMEPRELFHPSTWDLAE